MSRYRWDSEAGASGRYRDERGRYVAGAVVRGELDRYLTASDGAAKALAQGLRNRQLSLADWELGMRREIKRVQLTAVATERGGWANMRPQDYGRAGQAIREQYGYLSNFAGEVAAGKQRLDGTLDRRAQLYAQAGRQTFYASKHANRRPEVTLVRSIRNARDSCRGCVDLHGRWFQVGDPAYKLPGQRICNKNCLCSEEYGRETAEGEEVVEAA